MSGGARDRGQRPLAITGLHGADDMDAIIAKAGFPPERVLTPAADTGLVAQLAVESFRQAGGP